MNAHFIKLSNGTKSFTGKIIVCETSLIFLCINTGNALLEGATIGLFGAKGNRGWLLDAFETNNTSAALPDTVTENELKLLAGEMPGSIVFEANKIELLKQNWLVKMIKWDGNKIGVPSGFSSILLKELLPWANRKNIKTSGFNV